MEKAGTLQAHLEETGKEAQQLYETTVEQMQNQALASSKPYSKVVEILQSASQVASEVVMRELILVPPAGRGSGFIKQTMPTTRSDIIAAVAKAKAEA